MYSRKDYNKEKQARACARYLPVSPKDCREVARFIMGKKVTVAFNNLNLVLDKKMAVPFKRYNKDRGHKPGIGPGAYPEKAIKYIQGVLKNAVANAQQKGLDQSDLIILHASVNRAVPKERRRGKYAHFEVVLEEKKEQTPAKKTKQKKKVVEESGQEETGGDK